MPTLAYAKHKQATRERQARQTAAGQDIGALPAIANPQRRQRADEDFKFFCETYFPRVFTKPWCPDHLKVIAKIERAVIRVDLFAMAMPRGSGKTSLCRAGVLWAMLTGRRRVVMLVSPSEDKASNSLDHVKAHLGNNPLLLADYPEAVYPFRMLEGEARRCSGQRYLGQRTHIGWTAEEIIFPMIPASRCSGAIAVICGIDSSTARGYNHTTPDGETLRPTLVILDDPQTLDCARNPLQVAKLEDRINGEIRGMAGPGEPLSIMMPCTVIKPDDLAQRLLNRARNPQWHGETTKLVYAFPTNKDLWKQYHEIRVEGMNPEDNVLVRTARLIDAGSTIEPDSVITPESATEFYRANRAAMDEGAQVAWAERFDAKKGEISAIQNAMNLQYDLKASFESEYQNEPLVETAGIDLMTLDQIRAKLNKLPRGTAPIGAQHLVLSIDISEKMLWYTVVGWGDNFSGAVIDYGAWPDQRSLHYTLDSARFTLQGMYPNKTGPEGCIYAGLEALVESLVGRAWEKEGGGTISITKVCIDNNYRKYTETVNDYVRRSKWRGLLLPTFGKGITAGQRPWEMYTQQPGELLGFHWRIPSLAKTYMVRSGIIDTNFWKTMVHARLKTDFGDRGCLSLFGDRPEVHRMLAEHLLAEYPEPTTAKGVTVIEWKQRPNRDNHFLDTLVGCAVGASMLGVTFSAGVMPAAKKPEPRKPRAFRVL